MGAKLVTEKYGPKGKAEYFTVSIDKKSPRNSELDKTLI